MKRLLPILLLLPVLFSCSSSVGTIELDKAKNFHLVDNVFYTVPKDFADPNLMKETIEKFSNGLKGKKIFLDPGHGGEDRKNTSLSGQVVEADINLVVAKYLRDMLVEAGAEVMMSREVDTTIGLKERSIMANDSGADFFLSIHHNSTSDKNNYWINYTSTFYHAKKGDYEYEPGEWTLARYIQRDMAYAMQTSGGLGSFDGTYSDYWIYPGEGFSVLRETNIPSVLVECSFFSHLYEEKRLSDTTFNKLQAWGIFKGIAKYYHDGVPEITLLKSESAFREGSLNLVFGLEDKFGIDPTSVEVYFDKNKVEYSFDSNESKAKVDMPTVSKGEHELRVVCANGRGNYAMPYSRKILIK